VRPRRRLRGALAGLRDVATLTIGHRADGTPRSPGRAVADLRTYVAARRASDSGRPLDAVQGAAGLLVAHPDLAGALAIVSSVGFSRGELTAPLAATSRLRAIADAPSLKRRELKMRARLQETEPGWLPAIPGAVDPLEPRARNVVMHLLKESLPDRQSGYTIRSRATIGAQRDAGLEPFVVTPFGYPPSRPGDAVPAVEVVDGIAHHRLAPGTSTDLLGVDQLLSHTATLAADVARRERPAIIQAASGLRGYENALVGLALRAHLRRPLVYEVRGFLETAWTSDPTIAESAEWTRRRYATEARVMAAADAITTLSDAMRDEIVAKGIPPDRIVVVPNGIDPDEFTPMEPDPDLRRRYGLEDRWVFGYVSSMDHRREGHELLIDAASRMVRAGRRVTCILVGDGTLRAGLEASAVATAPPGAVIFTGRVPYDGVRAHLSLFDAFVVPRLPDRAARFVTPLKPYEAMAMALPLVVSDLPALSEIVGADERGLVFPTADAAALAAALERLMDDRASGRRLGAAGRAWVLAERTWAADGRRYRDLYEAVLDRFDPSAVPAPPPPSDEVAVGPA
jgi:glycosyltransferase involved in cell wall biosynthesis